MANFKMKGHTVLTQTGTDTPNWGTGAPTGAIVQVVQTLKTDVENRTTSSSSIDWADIPGMACNITPQTGNKLLTAVNLKCFIFFSFKLILKSPLLYTLY